MLRGLLPALIGRAGEAVWVVLGLHAVAVVVLQYVVCWLPEIAE